MSELHVKKLADVEKQYIIDEKTLVRLNKSCDEASAELIDAYGIQFKYNTHFFDDEGYKLDFGTLASRTNVITLKNCSVSLDSCPRYETLLRKRFNDCENYLRRQKSQMELSKIYFYNVKDGNNDINESVIFHKLKYLWGKLNLIDIRTKENIVYSYCKMIGFNLVSDLSLRYFTCLYSDVSGWGKTQITHALFERTSGTIFSKSGLQNINQFTFKNVAGSDFMLLDDFPKHLQNELATELNNIVSNRCTTSEGKGVDAVDYDGIYTRPILTQNIKFRPSNDTTNLIDQKMLEIETNRRLPLNPVEREATSNIVDELKHLPQGDFDIFFNACVKLYLDDKESFIDNHTLSGNDLDYYQTCLNDVIDAHKLYCHGYKKLSDICVEPTNSFFDNEEKKNKRQSYFYVCKRLSRAYSALTCTLRSGDLSFSGKAYGANEFKNYKLDAEILNELKQYIEPPNDDVLNHALQSDALCVFDDLL
jgi:hypothetical protein